MTDPTQPRGITRPLFDPHPTAVVVGAGSGGLTVAVGLSRFGKRVRLVEQGRVGGDCTNVGCIPSKALLHATASAGGRTGTEILAHVRSRRDELWHHETDEFGSTDGIDLQFGTARVVGSGRVEVTAADGSVDVVETDNVVIATGSRPWAIPIDGLSGPRLVTNETLFELEEVPSHLAIVGAGPIGVEMATAFARLGTRVTLLDAAERVLPTGLAAASDLVAGALRAAGVDVRTGRVATGYDETTGRLELGTLSGPRGTAGDATESVDGVDRVLVAVGRVPNSDGLGLEDLGVETDRGGRITVDAKSRTSVGGIWAVGDVSDRGGTTHAANAWGRRIIKAIIAPPAPAGPEPIIPAVTFADPEAASIGVQPADVPADVRRIVVDLARSDRAFTDEAGDGIVIVDVRRFSGRVLGATIVGPRAGELISIFSLAMTNGIRFPKWYGVVWPYPAYADVLGRAVDDFMSEHLTNLHRDFPRWLVGRLRRRS